MNISGSELAKLGLIVLLSFCLGAAVTCEVFHLLAGLLSN